MKIMLFLIAAFIPFYPDHQSEYVCQPCGSDCDLKVHNATGVCPVCNMPLVNKTSIRFTNLSLKDFCARLTSNPNALVLDVRSPGEFDGSTTHMETFGHFKNAVNININELERRMDELAKYKNKEILVYCSHSRRSPRASYLLGLNGFKDVKNMAGGVSTIQGQAKEDCFKENFVVHGH